jgi:MFS superfamily sulfate permease-like transporter
MNFDHMSDDELERRIATLLIDMAKVGTQIDFAKSEAAASGQYADRDWFNRARHAKKMMGREHQLATLALAKRRKAERQARNAAVERRFVEAAKRILTPCLFADLMREAEASAETL